MCELAIGFIVSRNFQYIYRALESLQSTQTPAQIYVVLNGGVDEVNRRRLATLRPDIEFIVHNEFKSFAANHNLILQHSREPYIALLNDDVDIQGNALDILIEYMKRHPETGLVGPQLENADGTLQVSQYSHLRLLRAMYKISGLARLTHQGSRARQFIRQLGIIKIASFRTFETATPVDIVKGTAMIVRRTAVEDVGMLDESFRMYVEEFDWQWRFHEKGWQVVIVPEARITHYGLGQVTLQLSGWKLREDRRSLLNYFIKHQPRWQTLMIRATIICSHGFWGLGWLLFNRQRAMNHFSIAAIGLFWTRPHL